MINDRIQKWLADASRRQEMRRATGVPGCNPVLDEANAIIRFMAGPGGPLEVADEAACELILSECRSWEDGGVMYWEVEPVQSVMTLDQEEIDIARTVSRAVRYLVARGLLAGHPTSQRLVRPLVVLKDA